MIISFDHPICDFSIDGNREYLLAIKGVWDSAAISMQVWNQEKSAYYPVDGGTYMETAKTEDRFISPSSKIRFITTGATENTHLSVQILRIKNN